jgi:hypothetical protein
MVQQALKKNADCQAKTAQSIDMTDRAIRHILNLPKQPCVFAMFTSFIFEIQLS